MSYSVGFGNKGIGVDVNFGQGDAISVPVNINSLDTDKVADRLADKLQLPEIDTTELAKQGDNPEATNSKILEEVAKIPDLKNIYSARFEQNSDGDNTWTMVMPVVSGVIMNEDDTVTIQM